MTRTPYRNIVGHGVIDALGKGPFLLSFRRNIDKEYGKNGRKQFAHTAKIIHPDRTGLKLIDKRYQANPYSRIPVPGP